MNIYYRIPVSDIPELDDMHGQDCRNVAGTEAIVSPHTSEARGVLEAVSTSTELTLKEAQDLRVEWDEGFPIG